MVSNRMLSILPLEWEEVRHLPVEKKALYFSLCFVVSELNALQRLALLSFEVFPSQREFEAAARIQSNSLIRVISGKCHEAGKFLLSCVEKSRDKEVREICKVFVKRFESIEAEKGRFVSEYIRHKVAHHLDFREAVKSTSRVSSSINLNCYIHEADGNCFFPAGEDAIFEAGLVKAAPDAKHRIHSDEDHSAWVSWTTSVISLLKEMHAEVFERFILSSLSGNLRPATSLEIPEKLIARRDVDFLPLFLKGAE